MSKAHRHSIRSDVGGLERVERAPAAPVVAGTKPSTENCHRHGLGTAHIRATQVFDDGGVTPPERARTQSAYLVREDLLTEGRLAAQRLTVDRLGTRVPKSVLITGGSSGIGKECARQLALERGCETIYLGCRHRGRAEAAKLSLERSTGRAIFVIVIIDVSKPESIRAAVGSLPGPIEALVMNAGGLAGKHPDALTPEGVTELTAVNLLGHVILMDELLAANKLTKVAVYSASEAARGVPFMHIERPSLPTSSADEFASLCDGSAWNGRFDPVVAYASIKYVAALWMASVAREHPELRVVTVSPGGTVGTEVMRDLPQPVRFLYDVFGVRLLPLLGLVHSLPSGARRYVDVLSDASFASGKFYASEAESLTGPLVDQATIFPDLDNEQFQDNANEAIHRFIEANA